MTGKCLAFGGGGREARFRVKLDPLGLSSGRRQASAFKPGSQELHLAGKCPVSPALEGGVKGRT